MIYDNIPDALHLSSVKRKNAYRKLGARLDLLITGSCADIDDRHVRVPHRIGDIRFRDIRGNGKREFPFLGIHLAVSSDRSLHSDASSQRHPPVRKIDLLANRIGAHSRHIFARRRCRTSFYPAACREMEDRAFDRCVHFEFAECLLRII